MLTGRPLFDGETVTDTLAAVLRQDPDLTAVPPRFQRLLRLCLTRDPRQRLRDISGARLLLEEPAFLVRDARPARWVAATAASVTLALIAARHRVVWRSPGRAPMMRLSVDLGPEAFADPAPFSPSLPKASALPSPPARPRANRCWPRQLDRAQGQPAARNRRRNRPFLFTRRRVARVLRKRQAEQRARSRRRAAVLADNITNPRGASWSDDGSIVFTPIPPTGLSRVPSAGGAVKPLTDPAKKGQITHRWPQVLPGGRSLIFTAHVVTNGLDDAEIDALDLRTGQWKTVQKGGYFGRYIPSGHLLFVHQGQIFAVRFDVDRLATKGTPIPLLDNVASSRVTAAGRFDFSASPAGPGAFAYMSGNGDDVPSRWVWLDDAGAVQPVSPRGASLAQVSISPDGNLLAGMTGSIAAENIRVFDLHREVLTAITSQVQESGAGLGARQPPHRFRFVRAGSCRIVVGARGWRSPAAETRERQRCLSFRLVHTGRPPSRVQSGRRAEPVRISGRSRSI